MTRSYPTRQKAFATLGVPVAMVAFAFLKEVPIPRGRRTAPGIEVEPEAREQVQKALRLAPGTEP